MRQIKKELKTDFDENVARSILSHVRRAGSTKLYRVDLEKFLILSDFNEKVKEKERSTGNLNTPKLSKDKDKSSIGNQSQVIDKFDLSDSRQYWLSKFCYTLDTIKITLENLITSTTVVYGKGKNDSFISIVYNLLPSFLSLFTLLINFISFNRKERIY